MPREREKMFLFCLSFNPAFNVRFFFCGHKKLRKKIKAFSNTSSKSHVVVATWQNSLPR